MEERDVADQNESSTKRQKPSRTEKYRKKKKILIDEKHADEFKPIRKFKRSGFPSSLMAVCKDFKKPSPIQAQSWPILSAGRDLIGIAKTGSGKTLAFGLPGLVHVQKRMAEGDRGALMLVLSPTRELCVQTHTVLEAAGKTSGIRCACIFGGVAKEPQEKLLRSGAEVIVATPGRLIDFLTSGVAVLSKVSFVVLDEADRMLDMGFAPDLKKILPRTMANRQTAMFSATWPMEVRELAATFLKDAVHVTIGSQKLTANQDVRQIVEVMEPDERRARLLALLREHRKVARKILVFVLYKKEAGEMESLLRRNGYPDAAAIHGDLTQAKRDEVFSSFKTGNCTLMIATDVAARGLDVPDVDLVVNYTFPLTIEDYVHRIGRTGRAGRQGIAVTFFTSNEKGLAGSLGGVLRKAGVEVPEALTQWGMGVKRKEHSLYGAHYRDDIVGEAKNVKFESSDE